MNRLENALQTGVNKLHEGVVNAGGVIYQYLLPESPLFNRGILGATVDQLKFLHGRGFDDMSLAQKLKGKGLEAEVNEVNRRLKKEGKLPLDNLFTAGKWFVPEYGEDVTLLVAADGDDNIPARYYFLIEKFVEGDQGFSWKDVQDFLSESGAIISNG